MWTRASFLLYCMILGVVSSSTNYNYNAYNYDMAQTFTPDGRLLQVEYASSAAELSTPIVAVQIDNETLVLMTIKSTTSPQNRIVVLPNHYPNDGGRRHVKSSNMCVAMSGVLADSISLLQVGLGEASEQHRRYHAPMTVLKFAMSMANACQRHSFGGGIRPYGCTLLTCGFTSTGELVLYQTDPSGAILEATAPSTMERGPFLRWIVGGSTSVQRRFRKKVDSGLQKLYGKKTLPLLDVLALVGKALLKETQKEANKDAAGSGDSGQMTFEVVILNGKLGCYRLTKSQILHIKDRL